MLCGEESSDGATGQVPQGIAEWLGVPQITFARELFLREDGRLGGEREIRGGYEVIAVPLPAVVSVRLGINEPRFMDMDRRRAPEPVTIWSARDLGLNEEWVGFKGSPTVVSAVWQVGSRARRREFFHGTSREKARRLAERLRSLAVT